MLSYQPHYRHERGLPTNPRRQLPVATGKNITYVRQHIKFVQPGRNSPNISYCGTFEKHKRDAKSCYKGVIVNYKP